MALMQWVNLSKQSTFLDDKITTTDRCGTVAVDITVDKTDIAIAYKAKVTAVGSDNAVYLADEEQRNSNFKMSGGKIGVVDEKTVRLTELQLPAAGGNKYKVEVMDANGKVISSDTEIETRRRLYYQVISMQGVTIPASLSSFENDFRNEKEKFHVNLTEKGNGRGVMKLIKTISSYYDSSTKKSTSLNGDEFRDEARKLYTIKNLSPYGVAVVFSNYIATIELISLEFEINKLATTASPVSFGANDITVNVIDIYGDNHYLWHNLSSDDDVNDPKHWIEKGTAKFIDDNTGRQLNISDNDIAITGAAIGAEGGYSQLKIRLSESMSLYLNKNSVTLMLTLRVARGFSGGFSYNGLNLITVATKAWWRPSSEEGMMQILNHEMGHKIGMVAYGDKKKIDSSYKNNNEFYENKLLPNSPPNLYGENRGINDQGHLGPHCGVGATYHSPGTPTGGNAGQWTGKPLCVMYGATGLDDPLTGTYISTPKTFCPDCSKVVRKLDLDGSRLDGLKNQF